MRVYQFGGHLLLVRLHDEPEPVAGDGADAEGGHDDRKVLSGLHQLTEDVRLPAERPVAFEGVPERERRGEVAEEEVGDGEGQDERVARVQTKFPGIEDDGQQADVEDGAEDDDGKVEAEQQIEGVLGHFRVPVEHANRLKGVIAEL